VGQLEVGDVVVAVGGKRVDSFLPIEAALDEGVGDGVVFEVERGGATRQVELRVGDLHAITPDEYLEYSGGVLNPLSFHQARNASVPTHGVYVASAGYALSAAGVPRRAVITELAGVDTPDLETFERVLASKPHDARLTVRFFQLSQPNGRLVAVVRNDRRWFSMRHCRRDDATGRWPCVDSTEPPPPPASVPGETTIDGDGAFAVRRVARSLVMVKTSIPYRLDGVHGDQFHGTGLVVDTERGLVVVDRETVPIALGDFTITFASSLEVPGELVYLHPEHNLAVLRYDPSAIGSTNVEAAVLRDVDLDVGDPVWMVGLTSTERVVSRRTLIARRDPIQMPLTHPPRFRETNLELATLEDAAQTVGGVLADRLGRVTAFWASFSSGSDATTEGFFAAIPTAQLQRMVEPLRRGEPVDWHSLGLELESLTLAEARDRGLSDAQAQRLEHADPRSRRVLSVLQRSVGTPGDALFREGDLILAIDGKPVTRMRHMARVDRGRPVRVEVLRGGEERMLDVVPQRMSGEGTTRAVLWAGALLQAPHPVLASQYRIPPGGVYVSRHWFGSPATRYRLEATHRIVEVDGRPVEDLDGFLALVADKQDGDAVRLETVDLDGRPAVITLKLDLEYWPTCELRRGEAGWERRSGPGA
jgi:S1-C subfamily serine protease